MLDSVRRAGLIPDDRERDIELIVDQHPVTSRSLEGTGVVITYPQNESIQKAAT